MRGKDIFVMLCRGRCSIGLGESIAIKWKILCISVSSVDSVAMIFVSMVCIVVLTSESSTSEITESWKILKESIKSNTKVILACIASPFRFKESILSCQCKHNMNC